MNAIIYIRVSTTEQAELGYSLKAQEESCLEYAKRNNYNVLKIFKEEGESAKTTNRTELQKLLNYIQIKHNYINHLIVYKLDRLSRNLLDYSLLIDLLSKHGITLKSATETIGDNPEGKLMQNIIASFAQFENDVRSQRALLGMTQAVKEGRYVSRPPLGYSIRKTTSKSYLIPSTDKDFIIKIFKDFTNGKKQYEILEDLRLLNFQISKQSIINILKNPIYIGKLRSGLVDGLINGIHEPLIDEDIFYKAQLILNNGGKEVYISDFLTDFPLRKFIKCPECNRSLTGSWSKGREKKYPYYHCTKKGCSFKPIRKESAEDIFVKFLKDLEPSKELISSFLKNISDFVLVKEEENKKIIIILSKEIQKFEIKKTKIEDLLIEGTFDKKTYSKRIAKIEEEISIKRIDLSNIQKDKIDIGSLLNYGKHFLINLSKFWINSDIEIKRRFQELIFPEGIFIEGGKLRTIKIPTILHVFKANFGSPSNKGAKRSIIV